MRLQIVRRAIQQRCSSYSRCVHTAPRSRFGSPQRTGAPAFWASWADALHMIHLRHPSVADEIVSGTSDPGDCPTFQSLARITRDLAGLASFELPSWDSLLHGARPSPRDPDEFEQSSQKFGWQHEAASRVEHHHRDRVLFPLLSDHEKYLVCVKSGASNRYSLVLVHFLSHIFKFLLKKKKAAFILLPRPRTDVSSGTICLPLGAGKTSEQSWIQNLQRELHVWTRCGPKQPRLSPDGSCRTAESCSGGSSHARCHRQSAQGACTDERRRCRGVGWRPGLSVKLHGGPRRRGWGQAPLQGQAVWFDLKMQSQVRIARCSCW